MSKKKQPSDKCPLCRKKKDEFEVHHVIWRAEGGTNDPVNLLRICKTCHAIITHGCVRDRAYLEKMCFYHQLATHGLSFILKSGLLTGTHILKDKVLQAVSIDDSASESDTQLKAMSRIAFDGLKWNVI